MTARRGAPAHAALAVGRLGATAVLAAALPLAAMASARGSEAFLPAPPLTSASAESSEPAELAPAGGATPRPHGPPPIRQLSQAWRASHGPLVARAEALRPRALRLGFREFDPAARAILMDPSGGTPLERARAAVELAPHLPAAQAALAAALLREERDVGGAIEAAARSIEAFGHHLDGSLWLGVTASVLFAWVLLGAGLLFVGLAAFGALRHAGHDLGDGLARSLPAFGGTALIGALLLLPAGLGEGLLGCVALLFGIVFCYAHASRRWALGAAALLITLGLHPATELAARALAAFGSDAVAEAAASVELGLASPTDVQRLERVDGLDPLATRALAVHAARGEDLRHADRRYRSLMDEDPPDARVLNNAANVRLALGDRDGAISLYERALTELPTSAPIWFNLAQAYASAFLVEDHAAALAQAQALDEKGIRELTELLASSDGGPVVDLPIPVSAVWGRRLRVAQPRAAAALRRPIAPGRLGATPLATAGIFALLGGLGALARTRFRISRSCTQCGRRICPRCPPRPATETLCQGCARLLHPPKAAVDAPLRRERLASLRHRTRRHQHLRRASALLIPGAAGLLADRPMSSLLAILFFLGGVAAIHGRDAVVADPLAAGSAAALLFLPTAVACLLAYVATTGLALLRGAD